MKIFSLQKNSTRIQLCLFGKKILSLHRDVFPQVQKNHAAVLKRLRAKFGKEKIRVGFLIVDPSKWQYQSIYKEMEKDDRFEPVVLITVRTKQSQHYKTMKECKEFFSKLGIRSEYAYDESAGNFLPPSHFGIDILFYQQPWLVHDTQSPALVSRYALTCYVAYGMHVVTYKASYEKFFHRLMWKMFVENTMVREELERYIKAEITNCEPVGYAKLDAYHDFPPAKPEGRRIIIYAPHHSFAEGSLGTATFRQTGKAMLDFAREHTHEISWVFKPHPSFRRSVIENGIMTEQELDTYFRTWEEIGTIYDSGNYIELFRKSSALVTDCISFIGEYLPSGNPVFQLVSPNDPFNSLGHSILDSYYRASSIKDFEPLFERVILQGDDFKQEERKAKIPLLFDKNQRAVEKIMEILSRSLS